MEFGGFAIIHFCGGEFVGEIAEMMGFVIAGNLCRPFLLSFVPVDAFIL